jgi:hypothetical protein
VRYEQRIDVAGHAGGVVGQRHGRPADDEDVGDHSAPDQSLAQGSERLL